MRAGLPATAIVTLALAIGAATLMTSATQAVLLRRVPVTAPGQIIVAWGSNPAVTAGIIELSYLDIADLARDGRTLAAILSRVATLDAIVSEARAPWRFVAWVMAIFAGLAFLLSTVGLVSLVALEVANRRREIAIRSALGAGRQALIGGVLRSVHGRVAAVAALVTRTLGGLLVGVHALDWRTYLVVCVAVAAVSLVASYVPARRAARVDPLALLRD